MAFELLRLVNGPLEENCWVLHARGSREAVLIDPGSSPQQLREELDRRGLKPVQILATHGHYDHVGAVDALARAYGAPFAMAAADAFLLEALEDSYAFMGLGSTRKPNVDRHLSHGDVVEAAGLRLKVLATPGHTPGGLCFWHADSGHLFTGDTLFRGSIGRSDMEGGDGAALVAGIKRELFSLPDATQVHPGHGPSSTLAEEKAGNPYLR